jgi:hypothetical protein
MAASTSAVSAPDVERTDLSRWRLNSHEGGGRHVWTYLSHEEAQTAEPQRDEEKYWLGIEVVSLAHVRQQGQAARRRKLRAAVAPGVGAAAWR